MNLPFLFMNKIGIWEVLLIVLVVLILFGGRKIPELMKGLGTGLKEFKDATKNEGAATTDKDKD